MSRIPRDDNDVAGGALNACLAKALSVNDSGESVSNPDYSLARRPGKASGSGSPARGSDA